MYPDLSGHCLPQRLILKGVTFQRLLQQNIKYAGALAISSPDDELPGALSPQDEEHEAYKLRTEKLCTTTAIDLNDTTDTKRADSTDRMHMNNGK
ncbi:uncharacterized protein CLUP02_06350 [Colletotrichum lupini]|uniref:Uncharacterized protein n=1 Tax=Colletotrichum lupini TaxID=145971 RepID=A0A9Q8SP95_9PEZI|nr:uncharacterized protein CLUP02_06350 [Colletotrichum lupini]UQC80865.1 hypothetical protein CLUP02_06350 [Colletotrichum lupini]